MTTHRIICAYAITNRIITSGGNAAAAVRYTQRRAIDQMKHLLRSSRASPYGNKKNNYFGRIQTDVSCVLRRLSGYQYSSIDSQGVKQGLKVPVTIVIITPILLTCFAHVCMYTDPIERAAKKLGIIKWKFK